MHAPHQQHSHSLHVASNTHASNGFDLIKARATQTETSLLKQYVAGEPVDLLDDYDFPARTITETDSIFLCDYIFLLAKMNSYLRAIARFAGE